MNSLSSILRLSGSASSTLKHATGIQLRCLSTNPEVELLEKLLSMAKERKEPAAAPAPVASGPKFNIGTFNAISSEGLEKFPSDRYTINKMEEKPDQEIHAVLLRSHKMKSEEISDSVRAIARCGAGTNNIPVSEMTKRGIPVFNTPGANANAVKELTICALLLASRGIVEGIDHMKDIFVEDGEDIPKVKKRVESEKKLFVGGELTGKTIGVVGLGHIGTSVANAATALGMKVVGYDPTINVEMAWKLPGHISRASSLESLASSADFISLHVPYMKETHHLISSDILKSMKSNCHIVNFARGELVDSEAMAELYASEARTGKYVADFADESLHDNPRVILMPHLGASTAEAEANSATMAARQVMDFIQTGNIINSVNFPTVTLPRSEDSQSRLCIVNKNVPGMLGLITSTVGSAGLNIVQQINGSRGDIAYNVLDLEQFPSPEEVNSIQEEISKLDGVISSRMIGSAVPGYFLVNPNDS